MAQETLQQKQFAVFFFCTHFSFAVKTTTEANNNNKKNRQKSGIFLISYWLQLKASGENSYEQRILAITPSFTDWSSRFPTDFNQAAMCLDVKELLQQQPIEESALSHIQGVSAQC